MAARHFVPAAGHDWFLPFYDPVQKLLGADAARRQMLELAELAPGQRILEIGCGTGSLLLQIAALQPGLEIVGLDPDPKALARAQRKCASAAPLETPEGCSGTCCTPPTTCATTSRDASAC
jgi:SAM-dependent methyltransferase